MTEPERSSQSSMRTLKNVAVLLENGIEKHFNIMSLLCSSCDDCDIEHHSYMVQR